MNYPILKMCLLLSLLVSLTSCHEQRLHTPAQTAIEGPTGNPSTNHDYWKKLEGAITRTASHKSRDIEEAIKQIRGASIVNVDAELAEHALEVASFLESMNRAIVAKPAFSFGGTAAQETSNSASKSRSNGSSSSKSKKVPTIVSQDARTLIESVPVTTPAEADSVAAESSDGIQQIRELRIKLEDRCEKINRNSDHMRVFLSKGSGIDYATLPRLRLPPE